MTDVSVTKVEVKEDPAPELRVVPIEDLDKIEKLLDVAVNTLNMPNLGAIKQACMEELAQINATMAAEQAVAQAEYRKALAEYDAKREAERKAKEKERLAAEKKAADERRAKEGDPQPDSWVPPRDTLANPTGEPTVERRI
jgi:hypothetical protein